VIPSCTAYRSGVRVLAALTALLLLALMPAAQAAGRATEITWHGNQINLYDAQPVGRYGAGVTVAVLDGWVDGKHPDFEGRVLAGADCSSGTCVSGQPRDACTHGTHVAGTVASSSFGVATRAKVLPVRVLVDDGEGGCTGSSTDVAAGIRWATANGAQVMNLSLGGLVPGVSSSTDIPRAVAEAARAGVVVIFSAGNQQLPLADSYGNDALVVAATGPSGRLASYSQFGQGVDVAAPGGQPSGANCSQAICVTSLYPDRQYAVAAGTSMAAPHVSGLAALLLAQQPSRTRTAVLDRIRSTARPLSGAGSGLVDARAALGAKAAAPRPTSTATRAPVVTQPTAKPKPAVTKRPVIKASPTATKAPRPSPTSTTPTPSAAAADTDPVDPPPLATRVNRQPEEIPLPLTLLAAVLIAAGGMGTVVAYRR